MKISGNYTAVYMHDLPDVETCIDPFSFDSMTVQPNQFAHTLCHKTDSLLTTYTTITPVIAAHQF